MLLKNKNAIITGSNRGIGKAMLIAFAQNGANIWAHARKESSEFTELINTVSKEYDVKIWPVYFDLTNYTEMKNAVVKIKDYKMNIDVLVNNAGIMNNSLFQMTTKDTLYEQFEINFFSIFMFTQYISKFMVRQNSGSIINIASIAALDGFEGQSVYGATKSAIIAMTRSISNELSLNSIRVNTIAPGVIDTDLINVMSKEIIEKNIANTALKRLGKPFEIANTAVFLASEYSSYITGQVIRVDGGRL